MNIHPTHKMRFSDSSLYDEICMYCAIPDYCFNSTNDDRLAAPCSEIYKHKYETKEIE